MPPNGLLRCSMDEIDLAAPDGADGNVRVVVKGLAALSGASLAVLGVVGWFHELG